MPFDVLRGADEEMQTRFSPLISRRAGEIMSELTAGRYEKLVFDKGFSAGAKAADDVVARDALSLSEGTADDSERVFMARYPGDDFVDIIGCDDYTIGANSGDDAGESWWSRLIGGNFNKDTEKQTTIAYLRNLTTEAANRGKACGLFETGVKGQEGDSYKTHYEVLTASGVRMGFVNTWGGATIPDTNAGIDSWWGGYLNKTNVLWSPKDSVDLPGNPTLPTVILKYW